MKALGSLCIRAYTVSVRNEKESVKNGAFKVTFRLLSEEVCQTFKKSF